MKLSDIVSYLNLLQTLNTDFEAQNLSKEMLNTITVVKNSGISESAVVEQLEQAQAAVETATQQFAHSFDTAKQAVQQLIEQKEPEYFANSLELYNTGYRYDSAEHIRDRTISVDPITAVLIHERLRLYSTWQHPAMILRPAHALHIQELVACDPTYYVDTHPDLLTATDSWFTPEYQRRLRKYVITEYTEQPLFADLPADQFGLIYAFHFFNYRPMPVLEKYLTECFALLRPGGLLAFTYNNCDLFRRVGAVEHYSGCYTPGRLVKKLALDLGYEIHYAFDDDSNTNWLELRKPGEWSSIKGAQTLAAILRRPDLDDVANKVDMPPESAYNELNILLNIAQRLGIDLKQCTTKGQYSAKKVRRGIEQHIYPQILTEDVVRKLFNQRNKS